MQITQPFVHHVYFWLADPQDKKAKEALQKGLEKISNIPTIQLFHIGMPADTNREVIDTSYTFSWLALFNNKEDEETYQTHPIHLQFVEECKHLWKKVLVYDSVSL